MKKQLLPSILASSLLFAQHAYADHPANETEDDDFLDFSLEELISVDIPDVTSVSRKKQRLMDSAAAIYVITSEDIHRSGVTSIPEALRMVPGMQVARLNGNTWSISTRGFNYIFANKLLVLIDGRTVYSPLFSGVNWDVQDTLMEDIDRIEVIRGPGAALWGANAVNGVINVITKTAADTQGNLISAGGGTEEKAFGAYRYGGEFGDTGFYKVYFKAFERDGLATPAGNDANDDWKMKRAGFKTEWKPTVDTDFTVQGDIYQGTTRPTLMEFKKDEPEKEDQALTGIARDQRGGNISVYWKRTLSENHDYSLRAVLDDYQNFDYRVTEKRNTIDVEFQHYHQPFEGHDLVWGLGYRGTWYELSDMRNIVLQDSNGKPQDKRFDELYSFFIQDDITLNDKWTFTVSSRFEHNNFTGYEVQPNARLTWKATENRTFWTALSKAVKTPSISETAVTSRNITFLREDDLEFLSSFTSPPGMLAISGNRDLKSEKLTSFELGYREQFSESFRLDVTTFYNQYEDLIAYIDTGIGQCPLSGAEVLAVPLPNGQIFPLCTVAQVNGKPVVEYSTTFANKLKAKTYGLEVTADWQVNNWWKMQFNYSWFNIEASRPKDPVNETYLSENEALIEDLSANQTFNIRSNMNLPNQWYFDTWIRFMDKLKDAEAPSYTALDIRLAKKITDNLEFSLVGQNLFDKQRAEFTEVFSGLGATEIEESWYAQIRWSF